MRHIDELVRDADQIKANVENTFNDQEKYEQLSEKERTEMIREYMFVQAYDKMGRPPVDSEYEEDPAVKVYDELDMGSFYNKGRVVNSGNEYLPGEFAKVSDGPLLLRSLQRSDVQRIMYGYSYGNGINQSLKKSVDKVIANNDLEGALRRGEENVKKREEEAKRIREERERQKEESRKAEEAAKEQQLAAEKARFMRPMNDLISNAAGIKQEIENAFSDPERFKASRYEKG